MARIRRLLRGVIWKCRGELHGASVGWGLQVEAGVLVRHGLHRGVSIGSRVYIGQGVVFDVPRGSSLEIGERTKIMHYTIIAASESIRIGCWSQIAEHCSVRDSDHGMRLGLPMIAQQVSTPVVIGSDVWVCRGAAILRGTYVSDGCVVGANAVLKGNLPPRAVAAGVPASIRYYREESVWPDEGADGYGRKLGSSGREAQNVNTTL